MPSQQGITEAHIADGNARFDANYEEDDNGCWIWRGSRNRANYGRFTVGGRTWFAHRWSYLRAHGAIPTDLVLDHFACDNPPCVHPDHVRPVTILENLLRSDRTIAAVNLGKRTCPRGHEYPHAALGGRRRCLRCLWVNDTPLAPRERAKHSPRPHPLVSGLAYLLASKEAS